MIARDDDRPLRSGELVVLHIPAHAEDGARRILLARLDPEEQSRDLRDTGSHEVPGKLRSAGHAEPMVARLTEATALTEHMAIFVPGGCVGKPDHVGAGRCRRRGRARLDGFPLGAYTGSRARKGGNGCRRIWV